MSPVLNQHTVDRASAIATRMAMIMRMRAGATGSCTRDELVAAGFTESEIDIHRATAAKMAQEASVRQDDLSLAADKAEVRAIGSAMQATFRRMDQVHAELRAACGLATPQELLREVLDAVDYDAAAAARFGVKLAPALDRARDFIAGKPVPRRVRVPAALEMAVHQ